MASLTINDIDDAVFERLARDAEANHRTLEAEARARIAAPHVSRAELVERLWAVRIDPGPNYEGSLALIRAIRDEQ